MLSCTGRAAVPQQLRRLLRSRPFGNTDKPPALLTSRQYRTTACQLLGSIKEPLSDLPFSTCPGNGFAKFRRKLNTAAVTQCGPAHTSTSESLGSSETAEPSATKEHVDPNSTSRRSFIFIAIDGDSCWFHPNIVQHGRTGGWQAAAWLMNNLRYMFHLENGPTTDIVVQLFTNQRGNAQAYFNAHGISHQESDPFYEGLTESHPLLSVVIAGGAKEAADVKVNAALRFHVGLKECRYVGFAGLRDSSYAATIRELCTDGFQDKICLLQTSNVVAKDIHTLSNRHHIDGLPFISFDDGLFQPEFEQYRTNTNDSFHVRVK